MSPGKKRLTIDRPGPGFSPHNSHDTASWKPLACRRSWPRHRTRDLELDTFSTSFYLGRETLLSTGTAKMASWRKGLFAFLSRNSWNVTTYFGIPPNRVVELGSQVEL